MARCALGLINIQRVSALASSGCKGRHLRCLNTHRSTDMKAIYKDDTVRVVCVDSWANGFVGKVVDTLLGPKASMSMVDFGLGLQSPFFNTDLELQANR